MPAERRTPTLEQSPYSDAPWSLLPNHTGSTSPTESINVLGDLESLPVDGNAPRALHVRKKPASHIPRPPNAFILFRSWFIKSQHVSTDVETNHSTLSKIIGLTWQNLPEEDRQEWHHKAKLALADHKRRFPEYTFRPIHSKPRGTPTEKKREVGPKDQKRCAKIAELLVGGKRGRELEEAIQEFDKYHVPEIVTRFETPITANSFSSTASSNPDENPSLTSRKQSPARTHSKSVTSSRHKPPRPTVEIPPSQLQSEFSTTPPTTLFESPSFVIDDISPSFGYDPFAFRLHQPSPTSTIPKADILTQVVSPINQAFDQVAAYDPTLLSNHTDFRVDEWGRHDSPFSNSTISMPSTPSPVNIPFTDSYSSYFTDSTYVPMDGSYGDYPQYPHPYTVEQTYPPKDTEDINLYPTFRSDIIRPPMIQPDLNFSTFMESITSYAL